MQLSSSGASAASRAISQLSGRRVSSKFQAVTSSPPPSVASVSSGAAEEHAAPSDRRAFLCSWKSRFLLLVLLIPLGIWLYAWKTFPSDQTPEGAYLRVVKAVSQHAPAQFFAYLEEPAQHACYTIRDYRKRSLEQAQGVFPAEELARLEEKWGALAQAPDGADVFALYAEEQGWLLQLRRDVSGISHVEQVGDRASVQTVRGTRYAFRRRPNGIWGMTAFTATLVDEAERAARDHTLLLKAVEDYQRSSAAQENH